LVDADTEPMTDAEYRAGMALVTFGVRILLTAPVDRLRHNLAQVETLGPLVEPTAYLRGGADRLREQRELLDAVDRLVAVARKHQPETVLETDEAAPPVPLNGSQPSAKSISVEVPDSTLDRLWAAVEGHTGHGCDRCAGCGQLADTETREPWIVWETLPPGANAAVLLGQVRPIPCDKCGGSTAAPVPARPAPEFPDQHLSKAEQHAAEDWPTPKRAHHA
jgi:hypothetical protein